MLNFCQLRCHRKGQFWFRVSKGDGRLLQFSEEAGMVEMMNFVVCCMTFGFTSSRVSEIPYSIGMLLFPAYRLTGLAVVSLYCFSSLSPCYATQTMQYSVILSFDNMAPPQRLPLVR